MNNGRIYPKRLWTDAMDSLERQLRIQTIKEYFSTRKPIESAKKDIAL